MTPTDARLAEPLVVEFFSFSWETPPPRIISSAYGRCCSFRRWILPGSSSRSRASATAVFRDCSLLIPRQTFQREGVDPTPPRWRGRRKELIAIHHAPRHTMTPRHYFLHQCQQQSSPQSYPPSRPNTFPPKTSNSPRLQDDKRPVPGARCDWRRDGRQQSKAAIPQVHSSAIPIVRRTSFGDGTCPRVRSQIVGAGWNTHFASGRWTEQSCCRWMQMRRRMR